MSLETPETTGRWKCQNPACHHFRNLVSDDVRRSCAKISPCGFCSARQVVPPLPVGVAPAKKKRVPLAALFAAAAGLCVLVAIAFRSEEDQRDKRENGRQADEVRRDLEDDRGRENEKKGGAVNPTPEEIETARELIRDDVERLVTAGSELVQKFRAMAIAEEEADEAVKAQKFLTEVGRTPADRAARAQQIHADGNLLSKMAAKKKLEIDAEVQVYLKALERLIKADRAVVERQMAAMTRGIAGVSDKASALHLAKAHFAEAHAYWPLDSEKIFNDFKNAPSR